MDWLTAAFHALGDKIEARDVVTLVLIAVIDRRLLQMVKSLAETLSEVRSFATHNTGRMDEIRNAMMRFSRYMGREDGEKKPSA